MLTDQTYLKENQYKTPDNLNARIALHRLFGTNSYPWQQWVFDQLELQPGMRILEVGCGPAELWQENLFRFPAGIRVTACDLSMGMLVKARQSLVEARDFWYMNIDAQAIPFPACYFDKVIANHMLYHVPDIDLAISEIWRVLKPGAMLCAATNGNKHMTELRNLISLFKPEYRGMEGAAKRFSLENSEQYLRKTFSRTKVRIFEADLIVTETEPLIAYILSMWGIYPELDKEKLTALAEHVQQIIATKGSFPITKSQGVAIAWK
jgi:ubiquinone/menaquinone biosynthesis C-methylase UbiE